MEEYSLDRHLKSYCDAHEEYQNLYATWSLNRKSCSEMLKTVLLRYPHYSLHDASHAEAILSKIEMLLGSRVSQLSPTDTWLVLHAAYAHDLGMVVQWRDLQKAWSDLAFQNYLTSLAEGEDKDLRNAVQWLRKMEAADLSGVQRFASHSRSPLLLRLRLLASPFTTGTSSTTLWKHKTVWENFRFWTKSAITTEHRFSRSMFQAIILRWGARRSHI